MRGSYSHWGVRPQVLLGDSWPFHGNLRYRSRLEHPSDRPASVIQRPLLSVMDTGRLLLLDF